MPDGSYDQDILRWAEHQAALLRRLAAGERVNELVDWPSLIEEVEDVGRSELRSCEGLIMRALEHLLKIKVWPDSADVPHWRGETVAFLADARRRYTPSMRQRIDMEALYADASRSVRERGGSSLWPATCLPVLAGCPFVVDDVVSPHATIDSLLEQIIG